MNLDSKLKQPDTIGSERQLIDFLKSHLEDTDKELLIAVEPEIYKDSKWYKKLESGSNVKVMAEIDILSKTSDLSQNDQRDVLDTTANCHAEKECSR